MISATGLTKNFDGFTAVDNLTLEVGKGELLALLGPNGAGKTTTVRMLAAILVPTAGTASINGCDIRDDADRVRRHVGLLTEQPGLYTRSSGLEYLLFFGSLYGISEDRIRSRALQLFDRFDMPDTVSRRLGEYSKGMRQKVGLIRAMLHDPAVLLLDEPTSAMDPHSSKLVRDAIMELRGDNKTILVCTHNLAEAELLADRIAIIRRGQIIALGTADELKHKLVGRRTFEIAVNEPLSGMLTGQLNEFVSVIEINRNTIRYATDEPQRDNPRLVAALSALGYGIVTLREQTATLEDVYLDVVGNENGID